VFVLLFEMRYAVMKGGQTWRMLADTALGVCDRSYPEGRQGKDTASLAAVDMTYGFVQLSDRVIP
jgi:hypothetical protein